jgi:hypothetical protein
MSPKESRDNHVKTRERHSPTYPSPNDIQEKRDDFLPPFHSNPPMKPSTLHCLDFLLQIDSTIPRAHSKILCMVKHGTHVDAYLVVLILFLICPLFRSRFGTMRYPHFSGSLSIDRCEVLMALAARAIGVYVGATYETIVSRA